MKTSLDEATALRLARKRAKALRDYYTNIATYVVVTAGLWVINIVSYREKTGWWALWVMVIWGGIEVLWGLSLAAEGRGFWFGPAWEERKVDELMAKHKLKRASSERELMQAQMRMLQAQIEPHFLFNTLANVQSLIRRDAPKAETMLESFIHYLRQSLMASRSQEGTLKQEVDLLTHYLGILKIRMGERLQFSIDVPQQLMSLPFAPMLLQPVIENAVRHGLEPKVEGGRIKVVVRRVEQQIEISVEDDGLGLTESENVDLQSGVGLSNLRERLALIYDGRANLAISPREGGGVKAIMQLPIDV
jgi:sensor histidine kinase YesM